MKTFKAIGIFVTTLMYILGFASLTECSSTHTNTTDSDFLSGTLSDLQIHSTGTLAALELMNQWQYCAVTSSPSARVRHAMASDGKGNVILFGGDEMGDTWEFNPSNNAWSQLEPATSPAARGSHCMVWCWEEEFITMVGCGGEYGPYENETWAFNPGTGNWQKKSPSGDIPEGAAHAAAYDGSGKIVLFGGHTVGNAVSTRTWIYDIPADSWTEVHPAATPTARHRHSMAYHSPGKVLLFGGGQSDDTPYGDTWIYDVAANNWTEVTTSTSPSPRVYGRLTYDSRNNVIMLFGGKEEISLPPAIYYNDTWIFDPLVNEWKRQEPLYPDGTPEERDQHAIAYEQAKAATILFSGSSGDADTWLYYLRSSGTFISGDIDSGSAPTSPFWGTISWDTTTIPGDATVKTQIAAGDTPGPGNFVGPDGAISTFYDTSGQLIWNGHNEHRYLRYKLFMSRTVVGSTEPFQLGSVSVSVNHPPTPPPGIGIGSVPDGGGTSEASPTLEWQNSSDYDGDNRWYHMQVDTATDFASPDYEVTEITQTPTRTSHKPDLWEGNWYWRVRGTDHTHYGDWSDVWSFYIDTSPPTQVTDITTLTGPGNGEITLYWSAPEDPGFSVLNGTSVVKASSDPALGDVNGWTETRWNNWPATTVNRATSTTPGTPQSIVVAGLADAATYYIALRTKDSAGNESQISPTVSARTNSPPWVIVNAPGSGDVWTGNKTISWSAGDPDETDTLSFKIEISRDGGNTYYKTITGDLPDGATSYDWDTREVANGTQFRIKVTAKDQRGLAGLDESDDSFEIANPNESPSVSIQSPQGGASLAGTIPVKWDCWDPNREDSLYYDFLVSDDGGSSWDYLIQNAYLGQETTYWTYNWNTAQHADCTNYYVKVAIRDSEYQATDTTGPFKLANHYPTSFQLAEPQNNSFVFSTQPQLSWTSSQDPDGEQLTYRVVLSTSQSFEPYTEYSGITGTSFVPSQALNDLTKYWWRVTAIDGHVLETEAGNSPLTFTVDVVTPRIIGTIPADNQRALPEEYGNIDIAFNKEMDTSTLRASYFQLTDEFSRQVPLSAVSVSTNSITLVPDAVPLYRPSLLYKIFATQAVTDQSGRPVVNPEFKFYTLLAHTDNTVLQDAEESITIFIPANSFQQDVYIYRVRTDWNESNAMSRARDDTQTSIVLRTFVPDGWLTEATDKNKKPSEPVNPITITVPYNDTDNDGYVDGTMIGEKYVRLARISENGKWQIIPDQSVNEKSNEVAAGSKELSLFGLVALAPIDEKTISEVLNFPNPFNPSSINPDLATTKIRYLLLEDSKVKIRIWTTMGDLVWEYEEDQNADLFYTQEIKWDGRNGNGYIVANGMYICQVSATPVSGGKPVLRTRLIGVLK